MIRVSAIRPERGDSRVVPYYVLALGALMVGALVLRLVAIDSRTLWSDEAYRVWAARQPAFFDVLRAAWAQPPSAPLYWLALHGWIALFGHSDVAVRLLSVPASVAAVGATYRLGCLAAGRATGLLAAGLLALSPMAVETGQEATMYAWSMLFAALSMAAALFALRSGRGLGLYVAAGTLLLYTHYMGALLLGELLVLGLARRERAVTRRRWAGTHAMLLLLWSPWLFAMGLRAAQRWEELSHLQHRAGLEELYGSAVNLAVAASAASTWPPAEVALGVVMGVALALLGLVLARSRELWSLAAIAAGFVCTIVGVSAATGAWLVQPRFLTLILPAFLVVVAAGFTTPVLRMRSHAALPLLAALLMAQWVTLQASGVRSFYTNPVHGRNGLREMTALLRSEVRRGDLVTANHALLPWSIAQYYDGPVLALPQSQDVREGYPLWPLPGAVDFATPQWEVLQKQAARAERVWLVYLPVMDGGGRLLQHARERFAQLEARSYPLADLYLFGARK